MRPVRMLAVFVAACALGSLGCSRPYAPLALDLAPASAYLSAQGAKNVYYNAAALNGLLQSPPDWLPLADRQPGSERVRSMVQAALTPSLFRQLDRQSRFDALLLAGDPVQFKPLMEHLSKTQDWALERVDPFCLVYRRGAASGLKSEGIWKVVDEWAAKEPALRASAMAAMAERLVAASRMDAASELIEAAKKIAPSHPAVCTAEGWYKLARGEWAPAVAAADRALKADRRNRPALSVKAQGLYFSRKFAAAYELSRGLLEDAPNDPVMLFNHAKMAHEVRSFDEEIEILRKLIALAEREKRSSCWYQVYLGQALATTGHGAEALESFEKALADPELPADQRDFAKSAKAKVALQLHPEAPTGHETK